MRSAIPDIEEQRQYALFDTEVELLEVVNGIPEGAKGRIVQVRPGTLGSSWTYAFKVDNWGTTRHPFTLVTKDQFKVRP